jgi:hypothetical protein
VYIDEPHAGTLIATLPIPGTAVGAGWQTVKADTAPVAGTHAVFLVFQPDHGQIGDLSFFGFERKEEGTATGLPGVPAPALARVDCAIDHALVWSIAQSTRWGRVSRG